MYRVPSVVWFKVVTLINKLKERKWFCCTLHDRTVETGQHTADEGDIHGTGRGKLKVGESPEGDHMGLVWFPVLLRCN